MTLTPQERAEHEWVVSFADGEITFEHLVCNLSGADRPCAVIDCPADHEDVSRDCIGKHGAKALDECWAVSWEENGGRESVNTEALRDVRIPVMVSWDEGVVLHEATFSALEIAELEIEARGQKIDALFRHLDVAWAELERLRGTAAFYRSAAWAARRAAADLARQDPGGES